MSVTLLSDFMSNFSQKRLGFLLRGKGDSKRDIASLFESLISGRGEISCFVIAEEIFNQWEALDTAAKRDCLVALAQRFGPDMDAIRAQMRSIEENPTPENFRRLHTLSEPRSQELIRRLNHARNGTRRLVRMRETLLDTLADNSALAGIDQDFVHLFISWFNRGFLELKPISWETSAAVLERVIRYEAVHTITDWNDLRRRIEPEDRRLFAFFHPQMNDEPLIFVEVALTTSIPGSIVDVLKSERPIVARNEATTAVFYSISNCQKGLRGISFGNFLIKQVVEVLRRELPNLKTFVTLSPVPNFARWLTSVRSDPDQTILSQADIALLARTDEKGWHEDKALVAQLNPMLRGLAIRYFTQARNSRNQSFDSVARFHLGNGASLEEIHVLADTSPKALANSYGLMVNYLYKTDDIETNHENYAETGAIATSARLKTLLKTILAR